MKTLITEGVLRKLPTADTDIYDTRARGLVLRCRASGSHSYRLQVRRGRWLTIGAIDDFSPAQARAEADRLRGDLARGKDPDVERRLLRSSTFKQYLTHEYGPWVTANRRTGAETLQRLRQAFAELLPLPIGEVTRARVERRRTTRLAAKTAASTVNRDLAALRASLSHAVRTDLLPSHPLARLRSARVDSRGVVRYLSAAEEERLRSALAERDSRRRQARESANLWRRERSYDELPSYGAYTDHLTPLTLLALNTGCRRGELFGLTWADVEGDVDLNTVRGHADLKMTLRYAHLAPAIKVLLW